MAKIRKVNKARVKHKCDHCKGSVSVGESYEYTRIILVYDAMEYLDGQLDYAEKIDAYKRIECKNCIDSRVKRKYKQEQHEIRAKKRRENCPDADFQYEWCGGWSDGAPDGGDVELRCNKCNLYCS